MSRKHSPETIGKMRAYLLERWRDPEYRARGVAHLARVQPAAVVASKAAIAVLPPEGTPERRWYEKVRKHLGAEAARATL